ncbi:MAG: hypothetical protein ACYDBJ_18055 [Aggregatilineales bacterium]
MSTKNAQPISATPTEPAFDPLASEQIPDLVAMINEVNAEHFAKIAALEKQIADLKKTQQPNAPADEPVDDAQDAERAELAIEAEREYVAVGVSIVGTLAQWGALGLTCPDGTLDPDALINSVTDIAGALRTAVQSRSFYHGEELRTFDRGPKPPAGLTVPNTEGDLTPDERFALATIRAFKYADKQASDTPPQDAAQKAAATDDQAAQS